MSISEPLTIEKRHDFYDNRFTIAVYNTDDIFEGDKLVVNEMTDILENLLNIK